MGKKNFRRIPASVRKQLEGIAERHVVAACTRTFSAGDLRRGALKHLDVTLTPGGLEFPATKIAPSQSGKYSDRNINGYEEVRKDLPKETHYHSVETPNWGDPYYGTHTVDLPYEKYPRDFHPPQLAEIRIKAASTKPGQENYLLIFEVSRVLDKRSADFEDELLTSINLLQENVGACGVQKSGATLADYMKTIIVSWEILPPGTRDEAIARIFKGRTPSPKERATVEDRYAFLMGLDPKSLVYGFSGIQRYFGALVQDDLIVFENIEYGNAIYIMFSDWKTLSKRSRTELLSGRFGKNFERVLHVGSWKQSVKDIVAKNIKP